MKVCFQNNNGAAHETALLKKDMCATCGTCAILIFEELRIQNNLRHALENSLSFSLVDLRKMLFLFKLSLALASQIIFRCVAKLHSKFDAE